MEGRLCIGKDAVQCLPLNGYFCDVLIILLVSYAIKNIALSLELDDKFKPDQGSTSGSF